MNYCPLGACALAGTGLPIDRFMTSNALGFTAPLRNRKRIRIQWNLFVGSLPVIGDLVTLLTLCKGFPHTYNRDLQEDKEPVFDSVKTIVGMLEVSAEFALNITFNQEKIQKALPADHLDATNLADYLVKKVSRVCYNW
ncbi:hypothetical protein L6164_030677 [Bauhinia variegata]|uniref:Uncharacterized protein n=1 Tax=Bauhinia variegata TaxID=167791 RepID=A0ACB9LEE8_BAUVA|nr:hypothetical protein L6164_030677 [Bauhinia variegata]